MTFLCPEMLWLALLLPLLVVLHAWLLRLRKFAPLRFASLALVKEAMNQRHWRRRVPPALLLAAFGTLVIATARPTAVLTLPTHQQTIILAMDVSISMRATDMVPSRIGASQDAAKRFVAGLPHDVRVGVVSYAGSAHLVQPPTLARDDVFSAIDRFQLQSGTAIGKGIVVALATLFPDTGIDLSRLDKLDGQRNALHAALPGAASPDTPEFEPVEAGSYDSAVIVVLTDGQNTAGVDPVAAARMAADRGIRIFTVGFGTREGEIVTANGWRMRVRLDEETLRKVAELTRGQYFHAGSSADLERVYGALKARLVLEKKATEVTAVFAGLAAVLLLLGAGLSVWWFGRVA